MSDCSECKHEVNEYLCQRKTPRRIAKGMNIWNLRSFFPEFTNTELEQIFDLSVGAMDRLFEGLESTPSTFH